MIKYSHKTKKPACRQARAFSLIELLLAVTIFALALVIAFGAFTLTLGNQSFIQANSEVNTEGDRIIRQLSDDIINANGTGSASGATNYTDIKGILMFDADGYVKDASISSSAKFLVLYYKDSLKIYFQNDDKIMLYSQSGTSLPLAANQLKIDSILVSSSPVNDSKTESSELIFSGLSCYKTNGVAVGCSQQPFVTIGFGIRTKNYDSKPPAKRAKFLLRTRVVSRIQ